MSRVEERQKTRGRGNNHEPRQDRGEASKRRGEAKAAIVLPRGETSVSRHTSLLITQCKSRDATVFE